MTCTVIFNRENNPHDFHEEVAVAYCHEKLGWCPKYVDELFTNLDSAGLSQKDINTFMTLPKVSILYCTCHFAKAGTLLIKYDAPVKSRNPQNRY
ncbi:hypothetical protein MTBBW1_440024 [Desulfamplus magnetovallimortis]|uniref:Uncharacterized protein n=1 Tax=Desulfamplus magnetovallimortis TaxID=1246637 RepID=A0A1W1HH67_9BACT|nr:hypothetical protein MTBBW1_440024 [Desulfamplus magnetovallimortis]